MFIKAARGSDGVPLAIIGVEPVSIDEENNHGVRNYGSLPEATPLVVSPDDHLDGRLEDILKETPRFRDLPFLILFLAHLVVILGLAIAYGGRTTELYNKIDYNVTHWHTLVDDDTTSDQDWKQFEDMALTTQSWAPVYLPRIAYYIILPTALVAYLVGYIWTAAILPACPTVMVVSALLGSVAWTFLFTISVGMASGFNVFAMLFCGLAMACVGYYLKLVWKLIPFAAVNLSVAVRGISANCGMYIVAFIFSMVGFFWMLLLVFTLVGLIIAADESYQAQHPPPVGMSKKEYSAQEGNGSLNGFVMFAFLVSLYWTSQVLLVRRFSSHGIDELYRLASDAHG